MKSSTRNIVCAAMLYAAVCIPVFAQKDPSQTKDVLDGKRFLLRTDDIAASYTINNGISVGATTQMLQTGNGDVAKTVTTRTYTSTSEGGGGEFGAGVAMARLYNSANDIQVTISPGNNYWTVQVINVVTGNFQEFDLQESGYTPLGSVMAQIVTGDFNGDGYDDVAIAYSSSYPDSQNPTLTHYRFAMRVGTAVDPTRVDSGLQFGPEWRFPWDSNNATQGFPYAQARAKQLAVGDFNGDGRSDLAALLSDLKTIQFFTVDPKTLWFQPQAKAQLPDTLSGVGAALVAGRFRDDTSGSNTAFDELVAVGAPQNGTQTGPATVYSIPLNPGTTFSITPGSVTSSVLSLPSPWNQVQRIEATSGTLAAWASPNHVQLIIAITGFDGSSATEPFLKIASFDSQFTYQEQYSNDVRDDSDQCLTSLVLGNFDNFQSNTSPPQRSVNLSIAAYYRQGKNACFPPLTGDRNHVQIWTVNYTGTDYDVFPLPFNYDTPSPGLQGVFMAAGDSQGRSLRLGQPELVTVTDQIQPDLVLSVPPMHVDWVAPGVPNYDQGGQNADCPSPNTPCVFNLTVFPSASATNVPTFNTGLNFSSTADSSDQRKSQTSWGVSVKDTIERKISFSVPGIADVSNDIKNTTQYQHDNQVTKEYGEKKGKASSVSTTTGFADQVFFQERSHYVYYYPVLGKTACSSTTQNCSLPLYVEFSVPSLTTQTTYQDLDATQQEWYQPIHEPGNVLSYPWELSQLQNAFHDGVNTLTSEPTCQLTDTHPSTYKVNWNSSNNQTSTVGTTNKFSDDLSVSVAAQAGIEGFGSASVNYSFDLAASASLHTLNISNQGLSSSLGTLVSKPVFPDDIVNCCGYYFQNYVLGFQDPAITFQQQSTPNDPNKQPVQISELGPLFVEFLADVNSGVCQSSSNSWFTDVYKKPDVGLNHPARWQWDQNAKTVAFYAPDPAFSPLIEEFYWMKGLFITGQKNTEGSEPGPTLGKAIAGDQLAITTRVYDFSMVGATNVHVRIFGQPYCSSNASSEASCKNTQTGQTCDGNKLCGNAFQIGTDQVIGAIPGYETDVTASAPPNWVLVTVPFDTTNLSNMNLVFWVITWMEDNNGNVVAEMPDHGLNLQAFNPKTTYTDPTQIPIEAHSNNIGLYGAHVSFFVAPPPSPGALENPQPEGSPTKISVTLPHRRSILEKDNEVIAKITAGPDPIHTLTVQYFDGNPNTGGKLFDSQQVRFLEADSTLTHSSLYQPRSCGVHTIYTVAQASGGSPVTGSIQTRVVANTTQIIDAMIARTKQSGLPFRVEERLTFLLILARTAYHSNNERVGKELLDEYWTILKPFINKVPKGAADRLQGQISLIESCNAPGTPALRASSSSATPSAASSN